MANIPREVGELINPRMNEHRDVVFTEKGIAFHRYPFHASTMYPQNVLSYSAIKELNPDAAPPEVRSQNGEILFIEVQYKETLRQLASDQGLHIIRRVDVWALILEPFLDTTIHEDHQEQTLLTLAANDIKQEECLSLRERFATVMYAYNFDTMLWDWVHLGLYDLLHALSGNPFPQFKLSESEFSTFYWEAMELANRGQIE